MTPEFQALLDLNAAIDEVAVGIGEARDVLRRKPETIDDLARHDASQRIAARAFLKGVEQLQDLLAKVLRLVLVIEQEDLAGLSARALADKAASIGLIGSSERWSALVRLRNQLVHEYPLSKAQQLLRMQDAWDAVAALFAIMSMMTDYFAAHDYPEVCWGEHQ
jgi:hypothetical protein